MKTGRNDPCPCGSGKKYKKCCLDKDSGWVPPDVREAQIAEQIRANREKRARRGHSPVLAAGLIAALSGMEVRK